MLGILSTAAMAQTKIPAVCANDACSKTYKVVTNGQMVAIPLAQHYVRLDWQKPSSGTVDYYNVYQGTAVGGPYNLVSTAPMPLQGFPHLAPTSDLNTYIVTAFCILCSPQESDPSNEAQVTMPFIASSLTLSPNGVGLPIGSTHQFTASVADEFGHTTSACVVTGWTSANPAIASVNAATGVALGVSAGTTQISCADYGLTTPAPVTVEVAPDFSNPPTPCTAPCVVSSGTQGVAYSNTLTATGGTAPYTYTLTVGSLPTGLGIASGGLISGTPTVLETATFTIQLCDVLVACTSLQMNLTILAAPSGDGGPPDYSLASTSLADTTTPIAPLFVSTASPATTCSGDCQNAIKEETTLPGHIAGTYKQTRISDGVSLRGKSVSNFTPSGGDNARVISHPNGQFLYPTTGDGQKVFELSVVDHAFQVVNTANAASTPIIRGFGFEASGIVETRFFHRTTAGTASSIYQGDLTNLVGGHVVNGTTSYTDTLVFDYMGAGNCPGITPYTIGWVSQISVAMNDDVIIMALGPAGGNGQGYADKIFAYSKTRGVGGGPGCAVIDFATGQQWAFNTCAPGTCTGSEAATWQYLDVPTQCWGSRGSLGYGIHNAQISGDGNFAVVSRQNASSGWTKGGCANGPGEVIVNLNSGLNQFCENDGLQCAGHNSAGLSKGLYTYWATGMTIRPFSDLTAFTLFYNTPPIQDEHCSWPTDPADTLPWICAGDAVTAALGGVYTPKYLNMEIFSVDPTKTTTQVAKRFGYTRSCNANLGATCTDGIRDPFGPGNAIGVARPTGDGFFWASCQLHSMGLDLSGAPRCDVFGVYMGPQ